jgi:hypothetical protein
LSTGLLILTYTLQVVEDMSSCLGILSETTQHIDKNHMDMCRFTGANDIEYKKVIAALDRLMVTIKRKSDPAETKALRQDQLKTLMEALKFDQMDARHLTIKIAHSKTCRWLLTRPHYLDWLDTSKTDQHHGFLWIKGKPGTGKSTLMKFALSNFRKTMKDWIVTSFFFNARGTGLEKSTVGMYRSLLLQLLGRLPRLQTIFESLGLTSWNTGNDYVQSVETLKALFEDAVRLLGDASVVCFIDALDECDEDQIRDMVAFFQRLGEFAVSSSVRFHVLFSSRHYPHITIKWGLQLVLERQEGHSRDITTYISNELHIGDGGISKQIRSDVYKKAAGVFMWVVLVVGILNKEHDRGRRGAQLRRKLGEIPSDLHELFRDILTRDCHDPEELLLCIQWVLFARQPLKPEELYFAILSGTEPEDITPWNQEELTMEGIRQFILSSSKGLAEITRSTIPIVQFIHESVKDFLLKEKGLEAVWPDLGNNFEGEIHARLARCCCQYIDAPAVAKSITATNRDDPAEAINTPVHKAETPDNPGDTAETGAVLRQDIITAFPFLGYSIHHVLHHAESAEAAGVSEQAFMQNFPRIQWLRFHNLLENIKVRRHTLEASLLYILAEFGMPALIRALPYRQNCFTAENERYGPPIFAGLALQNLEAVNALVEVHLGTQLPATIRCGMEKELAGHVMFSRTFKFSRQKGVLYHVIASSSTSLFEAYNYAQDVISAWKDANGWAPLALAAAAGQEVVLKLFLSTGQFDINSKEEGKTALGWAARSGNEAIVKLLLATDHVEIDSRDEGGNTPLSLAAEEGNEAIVKLLLATGQVKIDSWNEGGNTPLSLAARRGNEAIVKLLLATGQVKINSRTAYGSTPLSLAVYNRHAAVVELLEAAGAAL